MGESNRTDIDYSLVTGGILHRLLTKLGLAQPGLTGVRVRAAGVILLTWVPLLVLSMAQGVAWGDSLRMPFLGDIIESTRFLLVAPLLIVCEAFIDPWIVQVVSYARDRLIPEEELPQFRQLIERATRWKDSNLVEILLLLSTFGWRSIETLVVPEETYSTWHQLPSSNEPTYAFLMSLYFARPLVRFLWLRWLWRYLIWSLFLFKLAALKLKVLPTYPDRQGGLGIIAVGHIRFAALAFIFGIQIASILADQILLDGKELMSFKYVVIGVVGIVLVVFLTPLLAFTRKLIDAKRIGLFEYGALVDEVNSAFQAKWVRGHQEIENAQLLNTGEVQSLSNLSSSYSIVREMRISLINKEILITFVLVTLMPFAPLLLMVYPCDELIKHVLKAVM